MKNGVKLLRDNHRYANLNASNLPIVYTNGPKLDKNEQSQIQRFPHREEVHKDVVRD
jgi:hypothetical protein